MSRALASIVVLVTCASVARPSRAQPEHRGSVVALASVGLSRSLDPPARNFGAPVAELRWGYRLSPRLEPDAGAALIAFPEAVPELRVGIRVHPFGGSALPVAGGLFVRPGLHALLAGGEGFEWGIGGEVGYLAEGRRLIGYAAVASTRVFRHPRVHLEARLGVGFRF